MMEKNDAWQFLIMERKIPIFVIGSGPSGIQFCLLLYIQLTISFVIGRKRAVRLRNQRLGRHLHSMSWVIMSCMTAVYDFYLDLDYSGYHKNLIYGGPLLSKKN